MPKHLIISGRVQGVGFRYAMLATAERLGVTGWVRNRRDGTVESVIQGDAGAVERMIAWAQHGPASAVVAEVKVSDGEGEFGDFQVRRTE
jgi:acylphosphatase